MIFLFFTIFIAMATKELYLQFGETHICKEESQIFLQIIDSPPTHQKDQGASKEARKV